MTQLIETALLIELLESWIGEVRITRSRRTPTRIRLKRRRYYRRHKSQIKRKQRRYRRKPRTRRLAKRRTKIKKRLHIRPGSRRRVRVAGLDIAANIFETSRGDRMGKDINSELKALQLELSQSPSEDLAIAFGKAKRLAEALDRKYGAVLESRNFKKKSKPLYEEREEVQVSDMEMDLDPLRFLPEHKEETLLSEEGFDELLLSGPKGSKELSEAVDMVKSDLAILAEDAKTMADLMRKGGADEVEARDILVQMVEYLDVAMESALVEEESEEEFFTIYLKPGVSEEQYEMLATKIGDFLGREVGIVSGSDGLNIYTDDKFDVQRAVDLIKKLIGDKISEVPGLETDETVEFGRRIGDELPGAVAEDGETKLSVMAARSIAKKIHDGELSWKEVEAALEKEYPEKLDKVGDFLADWELKPGTNDKITEDAKDITGGFAIGTSDEHLIKENAAEKGIELGQKEWDTLNDDFGKVERNAMVYLKKEHGITTRDEGHDSSGDLIGTFWAPKDKAEFLEDHSEKNEPLRTSSGTLNSDILWKGVSEIGQSLIDVDIYFFAIESGESDLHEDSGKNRFQEKLKANEGADKSVVEKASKTANEGSDYDRVIGIAKAVGDSGIVKHVEALKSIQDELGFKPDGMDQLMDEFGIKLLYELVMDMDWTREQIQQVAWGLPLSGLKMYGLEDLRGGGEPEEKPEEKPTESVNEAEKDDDEIPGLKANELLKPGDIFKVQDRKGTSYGVVVSGKDRHDRSDHFYYVNSDENGKFGENARAWSSNMFLGSTPEKVGHKNLKKQSAHGYEWYLTGNKKIDLNQMPNLDGRMSLFQELAPKALQAKYDKQEDQNYHAENAKMVNDFVTHLAKGGKPEDFKTEDVKIEASETEMNDIDVELNEAYGETDGFEEEMKEKIKAESHGDVPTKFLDAVEIGKRVYVHNHRNLDIVADHPSGGLVGKLLDIYPSGLKVKVQAHRVNNKHIKEGDHVFVTAPGMKTGAVNAFVEGIDPAVNSGLLYLSVMSSELLDLTYAKKKKSRGETESVNEESGKTISKYEIEDIGMEHSQYFQGRGTSGTDWDMVYVGIGNNQKDAIDDALEAVAEDGWEISSELSAEHAKADDKNNILTKMYVRFKESTDGKPFIDLIDINSEGELGEPQGASLHKGAIEASGLNAEDVAEEIISALEDAGHKLSNSDKKELEDAGRRANEGELHYHVAIYVKGDGNKKEDEDITIPSPTSQMGMSGGASDMSGAVGETFSSADGTVYEKEGDQGKKVNLEVFLDINHDGTIYSGNTPIISREIDYSEISSEAQKALKEMEKRFGASVFHWYAGSDGKDGLYTSDLFTVSGSDKAEALEYFPEKDAKEFRNDDELELNGVLTLTGIGFKDFTGREVKKEGVEEEANVAKNVSPQILAALTKEWEGATGGDKELPDDSAVKMRGGYVEHYWNDGEILRKDVYHVSKDGSLSLEDSFYRYDAGDKWQTTNQFESIETVVLSEDADASMAPPKKWFDKMYQGVHKSDPKYDDAKIRATVGNIWYHELSDKKRKAIRGKEKKKAPAKNIKKESVDALDFIESILVENEIPSTRQRLDKLIHQRADLSDKQIDAGEGEVFDTEIQKLKLELDKETLPEASKDMPKITGLIPAKNTVEVSHNGKLYYYKPKHGQISHLKVGDTIATGMLGHGFTQTTESEEVTETQKLLPVGTKVKLLGRHKKGEKTTFTGKTGTISGHHKVVGLGDAYKVKVGNETVDQVHPSAVERDSIKESENISEAFYGIDSDDEDDTEKTEAFIKKYPELAKQVQKVGDGYKLTPEAEKELKRTYDLFTSNETAHERMEGTEAKIKKEVERVIKKARPEFASKFKIAVDFHTQDSYVGDDAGSATITLTLGDQEEEFEPSALYYNGAHDAAQDALLPSGWDWATWFMDDESPLYSDSFSEAYEYDQITQALEQFSSTLDESDFDSDLIKKLGEFNYDEEEQDESVDEAYPDTAAFSDLQDNSLAEEDPENDEETEEDEPQEDDAYMTPTGQLGARTSLSYNGKHVGDFDEQDEAEQALAELMKKSKFWPNVWFVDDHGGQNLISKDFYKQYKVESEVTEGKWDVDITFKDVKAHVDDWMDSYVEGKPPLRIGGLGPKAQKQVVSYMKQHGYPASDVDFSGGTTGFSESDDFIPSIDPLGEAPKASADKKKALAQFRKPDFSDLKFKISNHPGIGVDEYQLSIAIPVDVDFFKKEGTGQLVHELHDYVGKELGVWLGPPTIGGLKDRAKGGMRTVTAYWDVKDPIAAYSMGKDLSQWRSTEEVVGKDEMKQRLAYAEKAIADADAFKAKARKEMEGLSKEETDKVWKEKYMPKFKEMTAAMEAKGLSYSAVKSRMRGEAVVESGLEESVYVTLNGQDYEYPSSLQNAKAIAMGLIKKDSNAKVEIQVFSGSKTHGSGGVLKYRLINKGGKLIKSAQIQPPAHWTGPTETEEAVTEAASTDMHKDLAATLLADTFMNEIEENYPALQREIAGPGDDIVDGMKMAAEEYGLNLDEYLPVKLVKSIEADANKKWAGKLTLKELYAHDENAAHRLMLMAVGHGVAPDDDQEIAEWLKGKGVDVHDLGHYENEHDTGAALADAMAEAKNIGRNEDMKPSFDPLKEKDEKEREHDDETDVNDGNIVKNDSEIR